MISLIKDLQNKIERTYALNTGITNIEKFIIGDVGYKKFYSEIDTKIVAKSSYSGCKVLIRNNGNNLNASIYYPDELIRILESNDPRQGLNDGNVDACASFVEELDHFLFVARNFRQNRPFSLLELELQANITKYLILKYFTALYNRSLKLSRSDKEYIRYHLFYKRQYDMDEPTEQRRYEDTRLFAIIYIKYLDKLPSKARLNDLRAFSRMGCSAKISHIQSVRK